MIWKLMLPESKKSPIKRPSASSESASRRHETTRTVDRKIKSETLSGTDENRKNTMLPYRNPDRLSPSKKSVEAAMSIQTSDRILVTILLELPPQLHNRVVLPSNHPKPKGKHPRLPMAFRNQYRNLPRTARVRYERRIAETEIDSRRRMLGIPKRETGQTHYLERSRMEA
jgi:hypothetical protein